MIYLYAYTNFKDGLDSLRRVKVIYDFLTENGKECELLLNEYRAQLTARDWGLPLATTIETIKDIDAVATPEDIVIIDSPEAIEGKVLSYPDRFKKVIYLNSQCENVNFGNSVVLEVFNKSNLLAPKLKKCVKNGKSIFIYGDSDYEKTILKNSDLFKDKNLDLYFGTYFFVKYEDKLTSIFNQLIDAQEYYNILEEYENIITTSPQIAIECALNGIKICFLELRELEECQKDLLQNLKVNISKKICDNFDKVELNNNDNMSILNIILSYV